MPAASASTNLLYSAAASAVTGRGSVYCRGNSVARAKLPIQVSITAGTGSVNIEGRSGPNEAWTVLATVTASGITLVDEGLQYSVNITAAAGLTVRVNADSPLRLAAQRTIAG